MNGIRTNSAIKLFILLAALTLSASGHWLASMDRPDQPVLARVETTGDISLLQLPIHAHLQGADGVDYTLVFASVSQLKQARVAYQILDKHVGGAEYYIITLLSGRQRASARGLDHVLLNDGKQILVRASARQAETLVELGFHLHRLDRTPMTLSKPKPKPEAHVAAVTPDNAIAQLINQVTQSKVETYARNLSGANSVTIGGAAYTIATRNTASGVPIQKATQYVYEFMQGLGLTVSYHNWTYSGYSSRNVIGELAGTSQASEIVLITAHLDDMPSGATAPGADDNGSGSTGVMICAELLKQQQFRRTVRFVFFTGEEQGLLGSDAYADSVYQAGANIVAVYNMDMIGYDASGAPSLRLHTRTTSNPGYSGDLAIANTFIDVVNAYGLSSGLSPVVDPDGITQSDHYPFWSNGYYGILSIEDHENDMTPYYHSTSDTTSTLNWTYFTNFIKASVGTASHLAIRDTGVISAGFTATPLSGAAPLAVQFTDASQGATSWSWNFGDGGASTVQNPNHTYSTAGVYNVTLTVTNASGSDTETKANYITVNQAQSPVAAFTASSTTISAGGSVTFTDQSLNNPVTWSWTFEGGSPATSTARNPVVIYNTAGTYDVTLTAMNAQGSDQEAKTDYITVSAASYCASKGNSQASEWMSRVRVANLDNSSGASQYTNFTSKTANLTRGSSASVTLNASYSGTVYTEYWRIWIDYNRDGDFLDSGEQALSKSGKTSVTGSFTPPASALSGVTRMRVSMKYSSAPTSCQTFSYGEVEDYSVNIQ